VVGGLRGLGLRYIHRSPPATANPTIKPRAAAGPARLRVGARAARVASGDRRSTCKGDVTGSHSLPFHTSRPSGDRIRATDGCATGAGSYLADSTRSSRPPQAAQRERRKVAATMAKPAQITTAAAPPMIASAAITRSVEPNESEKYRCPRLLPTDPPVKAPTTRQRGSATNQRRTLTADRHRTG